MSIEKLTIQEFLQLATEFPVVDVRSPGEYKHAHIPGAFSLPLFSDEERKIVGTAYKQQSKQHAIKLGLDFFGKKTVQMLEEVETLVLGKSKNVLVHCWRGGMRSASVAWLLNLYGFKVYTLTGGYKTFRNWCLEQFQKDYSFKILGGYTGSGKTEILKCLQHKGEQIIDLEALAQHKGSAFGNLGELEQPSQEMFENKLALKLFEASKKNSTIWLEDESQRIGTINIPSSLYQSIKTKPVYFLNIPFDKRLEYLSYVYGKFEKEKIANSIYRIQKRLGGLETKTALGYLTEDEIQNCFRVLLGYYDKQYKKCLTLKEHVVEFVKMIDCDRVDAIANAETLVQESALITAERKIMINE
jgi:tRNA 2-selenouridine synthase